MKKELETLKSYFPKAKFYEIFKGYHNGPGFQPTVVASDHGRPTQVPKRDIFQTEDNFYDDNIEFDKAVVITEGEIDCMSVWQSGYKNVMSVGCGANAVKTLFEQSKDFLNKFESIILFTDNDEYGNNMDKAFLEEFQGKVATVDKSLYLNCKDANEITIKHDAKQILKIIESGKITFDGEWDIDSQPYERLDPKDTKFIRTGIDSIDYAINTIQSRTVTLITGRSNAGKSTYVNQVMVNAIDTGFIFKV